ncbi:alpha/beta hydrolase [Ramlibacter sp. AW1]|uniref:Alpha/beta hydrolase n=1 Tax=Ramlibacter aurantiacus TaxID=2801330 RepID=A0A937D608_9BURK|nr:alpha/beta hydrolase [Ramlibacter aurantiacus]MBL0421852.1 alpha/beta hydrolase [Ramlibacter aurantiacus]
MQVRELRIPPAPRLALDVSGAGPLVLFVHGIGGNRGNWRAQLPAFADAYTAAAMDVRGYGDSDDWDGPLVYADLAHDIARVMDRFHVQRAHLVGLSMGGRIAMQFTKLYPQRLGSLTLVDTHLSFASLPAPEREQFVRTRREPLLAGKTVADIAPVVAAALAGPFATAAVRRQLEDSIRALRRDSYLKFLEATVESDTIGDLGFIDVPTHFVVGECDTLTPPELARRMAAQVRRDDVEVSVIARAGHLSNLENPDEFNRVVRGFLDRQARLERANLST